MAKPTNEEIVAALQAAGPDGLTVVELSHVLSVPWQSLTTRLRKMDACRQEGRLAWADWLTHPIVWRAVGFTRDGGRALRWSPEQNGWVEAAALA